jgi:hypothetical protein
MWKYSQNHGKLFEGSSVRLVNANADRRQFRFRTVFLRNSKRHRLFAHNFVFAYTTFALQLAFYHFIHLFLFFSVRLFHLNYYLSPDKDSYGLRTTTKPASTCCAIIRPPLLLDGGNDPGVYPPRSNAMSLLTCRVCQDTLQSQAP